MKLFDAYPEAYFKFSEEMKKQFIHDNIYIDIINSGRTTINEIIDSSGISYESQCFCKECFRSAPEEFFYMPTSTGGKYHGGFSSQENSIGGNIVHTRNVLNMSGKVLHRYKNAFSGREFEYEDMLKTSCILHDICKVLPGYVYSNKEHGERGADLIANVGKDLQHPISKFLQVIDFAVRNHMYLWRYDCVIEHIYNNSLEKYPEEFLTGLMLSECDYYASTIV